MDRDGTLIDDVGYLSRTDRISIREGVFEGVRTLLDRSYIPVVVTNQSGVARGLIENGQLHAIHRQLHEAFLEREAPVLAWYYCPHLPPDQLRPEEEDGANRSLLKTCDCRKPGHQLWREAASDLPGTVDFSASWSVGDRKRDVLPGCELGTGAVLVGNSNPAASADREIVSASSFREAVDVIRSQAD